MSDPSYGLIMLLKTVNSASNQRSISDRENLKQPLYNKRTLHDPPVKEKEVEENIFLINSHYESSKTDFANEGVSVVARKKRPRRQLPSPLFFYTLTRRLNYVLWKASVGACLLTLSQCFQFY